MKRIVIPGEIITKENKKILGGAYKDKEGIKALYVGVAYDTDLGVKVVPLKGKYDPKIGDIIIGKVITDDPFIYLLDINSYKNTVLPKRGFDSYLNVGEVVLLRVVGVNEVKDISVEYINKLYNGVLLTINPKKVARVIGKAKSMLEVIQKYTNTRLTIGANGYIYVVGEKADLVKEVLEKIEEYSHVDNLTNKIEEYLKEKTKE